MKHVGKGLVGILLLLLVALVVARNVLVKKGVEKVASQATDFRLSLGRVQVGLVRPSFAIRDLKLLNPPDFPEPSAIEVKTVSVTYDLPSFFTDEIHLKDMELDIPVVIVVRKQDGETNLERLQAAGNRKPADSPAGRGEGRAGGEGPSGGAGQEPKKFRIDRLHLKVGTVYVRDYTKSGKESQQGPFKVNIDTTIENVTSVQRIGSEVAGAVMADVGQKFMRDVQRTIEANQGSLEQLGKSVEGFLKNLSK